jgi:hypothetical protein
MDKTALKQARELAALTSSKHSLLRGIDASWACVSEKELFDAAAHYVGETIELVGKDKTSKRINENARLIVSQLKKDAETAGDPAWALFYQLALPGDAKGSDAPKQMCFSVSRDVVKRIVALYGYTVYDAAVAEKAPDWPPGARIAPR